MSRHYLSDVRVVEDITLAITLVYLGYEIYSVRKGQAGRVDFKIVIPELDFLDLQRDFIDGKLAIADAREFGRKHSEVMLKVRYARNVGEWIDEDLAKYARDTKFTVA